MSVLGRLTVLLTVLCYLNLALAHSHHDHTGQHSHQQIIDPDPSNATKLPLATRAHWMRVAIQALSDLSSPCPFAAFGTAIVNHTSASPLGDLICIGANSNAETGNPSLHGEIAGINNCTTVLTDPSGPYALSPSEALAAWHDLTLYTTAEPCPMCAAAIRWAGFKECIFATSIDGLIERGWGQISIASHDVFEQSWRLGHSTKLIGGVLANETDSLFSWQFQPDEACPKGCSRDDEGTCAQQ